MTDHAPTTNHIPAPISRAAFARLSGRARSTVTEACTGVLAAACLPGGRIDRAHPAARAYLAARGLLAGASSAVRELVTETDFAELAGVTVADVQSAHELEAARRGTRIDLGHEASLTYLAARPFPRDADGAVGPDAWPAGALAAADIDADTLDADHPRMRAFFARCDGVAPTDESVRAEFGA